MRWICLCVIFTCFCDCRYARVVYVCVGGDIKIGARSCGHMGVFVLVLFFYINIVWQKSLSVPLRPGTVVRTYFPDTPKVSLECGYLDKANLCLP